MKAFLLLALAPLLSAAPAVLAADPIAPAAAPAAVVAAESVGVAPPKVTSAVEEKNRSQNRGLELKAFTQALENRLVTALGATRKFKVVSRGDLDAVLAEQNLAASGNLNADDPDLAKRFRVAGVKSILLVTIDDFQDRVETFDSAALGQRLTRTIIRAAVSAKLIDSTTGVVRETVSVTPVTQDDLRGVLARLTTSADRADAISPELARLVSERVAQRLVDARFPAKVLAKSVDGVVTFNRGDGSGVLVGQEWGVYAVGEELTDPDTGESLGKEEVLVGRAVVTEVESKFSKARLIKDQGVDRGAVLRPVKLGSPDADAGEPAEKPTAKAPAAPAAGSSAPAAPTVSAPLAAPVKLTLDKNRKLKLGDKEITPEDAKEEFARLAATKAQVVVEADAAVTAETVQRVIKALGEAGVADVKVVTQE